MAGPSTVDDYLAQLPERPRKALEKLRGQVEKLAPDTTQSISYQMPTFKYRGRALLGFAAFKDHCSLFPVQQGGLRNPRAGARAIRHLWKGNDPLHSREAAPGGTDQEDREGPDRRDRGT